jgi:hypothetical protein
MAKWAAVLGCLVGLGFGLPCVFGIRYFSSHGQVWTFMGFPTYGGGPFERVGLETTLPLLVGFLLVCIMEIVDAWLLWRGSSSGAVLALGLLPFELAFWIGFALPFGLVVGVSRTVLVIRAWASLRA